MLGKAVTLLGDNQTEADWCADRPIFVLLTGKRLQSVCSPRLSGREPHGLRHVDVPLKSGSQLRAFDKAKPCHCYTETHTEDNLGRTSHFEDSCALQSQGLSGGRARPPGLNPASVALTVRNALEA